MRLYDKIKKEREFEHRKKDAKKAQIEANKLAAIEEEANDPQNLPALMNS